MVGRPNERRARAAPCGIEGHPQGIEVAAGVQGLEYLRKERKQVTGRHGIDHPSDTMVRRDPAHAKERLRIALAPGLLHCPLIGQKRRTLRREYGKRRQGRILHAVDAILPGPLVGGRPHHSLERLHQGAQTQGISGNNVPHAALAYKGPALLCRRPRLDKTPTGRLAFQPAVRNDFSMSESNLA